jgi:cardiolipin synthase (CMP-forming)
LIAVHPKRRKGYLGLTQNLPGANLRPGMTLANKITFVRILLVPFFVLELLLYKNTGNEWFRLFAIFFYGLASITDLLDGYIARHYNQQSRLGGILDPVADKLLIGAGVILLNSSNPNFTPMPFWFLAMVFTRDIVFFLVLIAVYHTSATVKFRARMPGKIATALQMGITLFILLRWKNTWGWPLMVVVAAITNIASLYLLRDVLQYLSVHRLVIWQRKNQSEVS